MAHACILFYIGEMLAEGFGAIGSDRDVRLAALSAHLGSYSASQECSHAGFRQQSYTIGAFDLHANRLVFIQPD